MAEAFEVNVSLEVDRFEAAITDWSRKVEEENRLGAIDAAEYLANKVQYELSKFPHSKKIPTPTQPFVGPPGMISGHLRDSVHVEIMPIRGFTKVSVRAVYARIQELGGFAGTNHSTYIPPRPYFTPVVESIRHPESAVSNIFYRHWVDAELEALHEFF